MKRIWLIDEGEVTGSMVSTWRQSYGLSRNERTGVWTWYDRRDSRPYEMRGDGAVGTLTETFETTEELLAHLEDYADTEHILAWVDENPCPAMEELRRATLGDDEDDR